MYQNIFYIIFPSDSIADDTKLISLISNNCAVIRRQVYTPVCFKLSCIWIIKHYELMIYVINVEGAYFSWQEFFKRLKSISVNLFSLCLHLWRLDVERRRKFKFHWAGKYLLQQSCKNLVYLYENICPIFKKDFEIMLKCWKKVSCVIFFLHWFQWLCMYVNLIQ